MCGDVSLAFMKNERQDRSFIDGRNKIGTDDF